MYDKPHATLDQSCCAQLTFHAAAAPCGAPHPCDTPAPRSATPPPAPPTPDHTPPTGPPWLSAGVRVSPRPSLARRGSPWPSVALCDSPWLSTALRGSPWLSVAPWASLWFSVALCSSPWPAVAFRGPPWLSVAVRGSPVAPCGSPVAPCRSKWLSVARSQQTRGPATPLPHTLPNAADRQRIEKIDCHEATRPFFGRQLRRAAMFAVRSLYVHCNKPQE